MKVAIFSGTFSDMNIVMDVLEDIDVRFLNDYKQRYGKEMEDNEVLHLFLLGVIAEHNRHEIVQTLGDILVQKASEEGLRLVLAEATNPKSMSLLQKYHGFEKYVNVEGDFIVHKYESNEHLNDIPATVADGIYIIVKEL
ncbi:N-acetyltransferase domain-containing protein OS=Lysinibacillus sphaericus OX=1421 GN=LS41612_03265 PE=4 SV=1 [Lysinibacillus sphaericus]